MPRPFARWPKEWPVEGSFDDFAWEDGVLYRRVYRINRRDYFDRMRAVMVPPTCKIILLYDLTLADGH